MTLGSRISQCRKAAGLSQEALGEKLGVSRQSISKWESDSTIPEIDKLIILSKLFSITIGELLGVEAPADTPNSSPRELTPQQEKMVEEIVSRYVNAIPQAAPAMPRRRWLWIAGGAAAILLALFTFFSGNTRMAQMESSIRTQADRITQIQTNTDSQISGLTDQLTEIVEKGASIVSDASVLMTGYDASSESLTFQLSATPKTTMEDTTAQFTVTSSSGESMTAEGTLSGLSFSNTVYVPICWDCVTVSVSFTSDGITSTETIDTFDNLATFARAYAWAEVDVSAFTLLKDQDPVSLRIAGSVTADIWLSDSFGLEDEDNNFFNATILFFCNGEQLAEQPFEITSDSSFYYDAEQDFDFTIPLANGFDSSDCCGLYLQYQDWLGRTYRTLLGYYDAASGETQYFHLLTNTTFFLYHDQATQETLSAYADDTPDIYYLLGDGSDAF